jgi:hypothetical protein
MYLKAFACFKHKLNRLYQLLTTEAVRQSLKRGLVHLEADVFLRF